MPCKAKSRTRHSTKAQTNGWWILHLSEYQWFPKTSTQCQPLIWIDLKHSQIITRYFYRKSFFTMSVYKTILFFIRFNIILCVWFFILFFYNPLKCIKYVLTLQTIWRFCCVIWLQSGQKEKTIFFFFII